MVPSLLKYSLIVFGFYHMVAGSFTLGPHRWIQNFSKNVYGLDIPTKVDAKYFVCLKFLGLMAVMLAIMTFIVAFSADQNAQAIGVCFYGILFIARSYFRYLYQAEFYEAYRLEFSRSLKNIIFNVCLSIGCFILAWMSCGSR